MADIDSAPAAILAAIAQDVNNWDDPIPCRLCGFDHVHICAVCVKQGPVITSISRDQVITQPVDVINERGSRVAIAYECESGCRYAVVIAFHKGQCFEELKIFRRESDLGEVDPTWWQGLWRD